MINEKGQFKKGHIPWVKGKKFPYKPNKKLRGRITWNKGKKGLQKGHSGSFKKGIVPWNKGKKGVYSDEIIEVMSNAAKGREHSLETRKKMAESHRGEKAYWWKGGVTPKIRLIRNSFEYVLWRKACMERDNFTCQKTGLRGGNLEVHHINNFSDFPELRFAIDNGITLREEVHEEFHKIYGWKNNTREQLEEFLWQEKIKT